MYMSKLWRFILKVYIIFLVVTAISFLILYKNTKAQAQNIKAVATNPPYLTFLFGRTNWVATANCVPYQDTVPLDQVAQELKARGLFGVGGIVTDRTYETTQYCQGYTTYPSWADLANLRDNYGWSFISQSKSYKDFTTFTTDTQRYEESCSTLPLFEAHGHNRAWGLFAYPNNKQDAAAQSIVTQCFAFGRKYVGGPNDLTTATTYPYTLKTLSVNGGRCNNPSLPCYNLQTQYAYNTPEKLITQIQPQADQYSLIQFYRFVVGKREGLTGLSWDCTSPDTNDHYTSQTELYCADDFYKVVDGRPLNAVVTDPATVAEAWGRVPPFTTPTPTVVTTPPTVTPTPTPYLIYPLADVYIDQSNPDQNFGQLKVLKTIGNPVKISYLKFNLSSLAGQTIKSAKFVFKVENASSSTHDIKLVEDNTWDELAVTYNNRPLGSSLLGQIKNATKVGSWGAVNITPVVQQKIGGVLSLTIETLGLDDLVIYSRETTSKPRLRIDF